MRISKYKTLGQYRILSSQKVDGVYRVLSLSEYRIFQFKFPFTVRIQRWVNAKKVCKLKWGDFTSLSRAESVVAEIEEKRLKNDSEDWLIIKSIAVKGEMEGLKISYDEMSDCGYIYLTEKKTPIEFTVPDESDLFNFDFDGNDELVGIEFMSSQRLAKFIRKNVNISVPRPELPIEESDAE